MAVYKAQLSAGPFKRGEIVDVDPEEFGSMIAKGWLKPYGEGTVEPAPEDAPQDEYVEPEPEVIEG